MEDLEFVRDNIVENIERTVEQDGYLILMAAFGGHGLEQIYLPEEFELYKEIVEELMKDYVIEPEDNVLEDFLFDLRELNFDHIYEEYTSNLDEPPKGRYNAIICAAIDTVVSAICNESERLGEETGDAEDDRYG